MLLFSMLVMLDSQHCVRNIFWRDTSLLFPLCSHWVSSLPLSGIPQPSNGSHLWMSSLAMWWTPYWWKGSKKPEFSQWSLFEYLRDTGERDESNRVSPSRDAWPGWKVVAVMVNICPRLKACLIHKDWHRGPVSCGTLAWLDFLDNPVKGPHCIITVFSPCLWDINADLWLQEFHTNRSEFKLNPDAVSVKSPQDPCLGLQG